MQTVWPPCTRSPFNWLATARVWSFSVSLYLLFRAPESAPPCPGSRTISPVQLAACVPEVALFALGIAPASEAKAVRTVRLAARPAATNTDTHNPKALVLDNTIPFFKGHGERGKLRPHLLQQYKYDDSWSVCLYARWRIFGTWDQRVDNGRTTRNGRIGGGLGVVSEGRVSSRTPCHACLSSSTR